MKYHSFLANFLVVVGISLKLKLRKIRCKNNSGQNSFKNIPFAYEITLGRQTKKLKPTKELNIQININSDTIWKSL